MDFIIREAPKRVLLVKNVSILYSRAVYSILSGDLDGSIGALPLEVSEPFFSSEKFIHKNNKSCIFFHFFPAVAMIGIDNLDWIGSFYAAVCMTE